MECPWHRGTGPIARLPYGTRCFVWTQAGSGWRFPRPHSWVLRGASCDLQAIGRFWVIDAADGLVAALESLGLCGQPAPKPMYDLAARRGLLFSSSVPLRDFIFEELLARSVNKRILSVSDGRFTTSAAC